ncbi:MAG TPA: SDR family oxidoreductase [Gemmataceae bacterium]|jgi:NAD(P)-dependent dehydrogenase (short-subunit alcohol dehydrogenase family)
MRLNDKIAIVTGAAHGIGRAIAEVFAAEGAWVLVADLDDAAGEATAAGIRDRSGRAAFRHVDVADEAQVAAAVHQAADAGGGRIDVLCNNASYLTTWHDVVEAPRDEWDRCLQVGLLGTAYFTRAVLPLMVPRRSGSIVNIASIQGIVGARGSAAYTSMKHAVVGLTRSVAYDYAPHNIRVNAICPGPIDTRIAAKPGDELYARQISKTPLGRVGQPREVAYAALFLASDEASYITGAVLPVDGGWTAI